MKKSMKSKLAMFAVAGAMAVSEQRELLHLLRLRMYIQIMQVQWLHAKNHILIQITSCLLLATITADMVIVRTDVNIIRQRFMYIQQ